jgi:hypothetical protein
MIFDKSETLFFELRAKYFRLGSLDCIRINHFPFFHIIRDLTTHKNNQDGNYVGVLVDGRLVGR